MNKKIPNAIDMVEQYLADNGYDGLYEPGECACRIGELAPCGEYFGSCLPGYLQPGDDEYDYRIGGDKEVNDD